MVSSLAFPLLLCVVAALVLTAVAAPPQTELTSPCPKLFKYGSVNAPGGWSGNLVLESEDDLHGVWIRLIFDSHPKEVIAEGYEVVQASDGGKEVLLKNRDVLLEAGSTTNVEISVKYEADKFTNLIGYRLNAKSVCPESNTIRKDFFEGDDTLNGFLSSLLANVKPNTLQPTFECGVRKSKSYPWQASISIKQRESGQDLCDATLVSPTHVLLPAHCVTFRNDVDTIPEGIISVSLAGSQEKVGVSKIVLHRGYDPETLADDLAILELNSAPRISDKVAPICVEERNFGGEAFLGAADGGRDDAEGSSVKVTDTTDCAAKHPQWAGLLQDSSFCGTYSPPGKSGCIAKSGSGIFSFKNGDATLLGITTLLPENNNNCRGDTTVIATDVTRYYKWILRSIS